ncbi:MAG: P-II family nitrogen regulator [Gammaproteobacteria bacterium]|nr:P-II family nitrogen regulator [Gammaproteobacteria bacterium]
MHFKLVIVLVNDDKTDAVVQAAREAGATGATILNQARGEGINVSRTFFGLSLETQRDMVLFLVEEHLSRKIIESVAEAGQFDNQEGSGIAFQIDVEDALGVTHQMRELSQIVEGEV